jgi:YHS domain-containing protein
MIGTSKGESAMKTLIIAIVSVFALWAYAPAVSMAADKCESGQQAKNPDYRRGDVATDPVSGTDIKKSGAMYTFEYKGVKYYFCSKDDLEKFKAAPENYLAKPGMTAEECKKCPGSEQHAKGPNYRIGDVAKDPVCDMDVKKSGAKYNYKYKGEKYYFCTAGNLEKFKADPERYLK